MAASCKINREVKHLGDILQSDQKKNIFFVFICSVIIIIAAKTSVFIVVLRA